MFRKLGGVVNMNFQKFTGHENLHFSRPEEVTD